MAQSHYLAVPLAWGMLYFLFGFVSHELSGAFIASGYIWLPAGIAMAALLLTTPSRWFPLLVLLVAAQILLGWLEQRDLWRMLLFSLDELGAATLAVWLVQRRAPLPMEGLPFVRGLLGAGVGASLLSGLFGAAWFQVTQGLSFWQTLRIWSLSDLVGILIMTPLLASWSQYRIGRWRSGIARSQLLPGLGSFIAMAGSAYVAFASDIDRLVLDIDFASTYIPLFFVALVTLQWGPRGGALAVAVLSLTTFVYNSLGRGPFVQLVQLHSSNALLEMQVYLATASLLSLSIGALKTRREQLHEEVARWKSAMELSLTASTQLAYTLDPQSLRFTWSGDVETRLGMPAASLQTLDQVLKLVSPLDQARLRQRWLDSADSLKCGECGEMPFRLQRDGAVVQDISRSLNDVPQARTMVAGVWRFTCAPAQG